MGPVSQSKDAIILVGGQGTRLASVVADRAKPMAEVAGRPFVDAVIRRLRAQGVTRIVMAMGHKAESVRAYYQGHPDIVCVMEHEPMGTGGAVVNAMKAVPDLSDPFYVLNGDSFYPFDLSAFDAAPCGVVLMGAVEMADSGRYGTLAIDDDRRVTGFVEKTGLATPGLVNAGVYCLRKPYFVALPPGPRSLERDVFPGLAEAGDLVAVPHPGPMLDIGLPETYAAAEEFFKEIGA